MTYIIINDIITAPLTPARTLLTPSAKYLRQPIGELVAIVLQETILSVSTFVVFGTTYDTVQAEFTVACWRPFLTPTALTPL